MKRLRRIVSEEHNVYDLDIPQGLALVLERALSVVSPSNATSRCLFCPVAPEIIRYEIY